MDIIRLIIAVVVLKTPTPMPAAEVGIGGLIEINIYGVITEETLSYVERSLSQKGIKQIFVHIDSVGGSAYAGLGIRKLLVESTVPTVCIDEGEASSAAMMIMQSCDVRLMYEDATMLAHGMKVSIDGNVGYSDLKSLLDTLNELNHIAWITMLGRTTIEEDLAVQLFNEGYDIIFDSESAISLGAVDAIIPRINEDEIPTEPVESDPAQVNR